MCIAAQRAPNEFHFFLFHVRCFPYACVIGASGVCHGKEMGNIGPGDLNIHSIYQICTCIYYQPIKSFLIIHIIEFYFFSIFCLHLLHSIFIRPTDYFVKQYETHIVFFFFFISFELTECIVLWN